MRKRDRCVQVVVVAGNGHGPLVEVLQGAVVVRDEVSVDKLISDIVGV